MYNFNLQKRTNGAWVSVANWVRPFYDAATLDETLDSGNLDLSMVSMSNAEIKPFERVKIMVSNNGVVVDTIYTLTANTAETQRTFAE